MTIPEIKAELDKAGIAYDASALKADLEALLPADVKAAAEANDAAEAAKAAETPEPAPTAPVEPVAAPVDDEVTVDQLTVPVEGDSEARLALKATYAEYYKKNPDRADWKEEKKNLLIQLNKLD